ncbi:MAG: DEAD/DEAH box helicase [Campylobacterota bacterium]|nr:DEAD/DEAH box helicase [Campylobacterota bacterium]
MKITKKDLSHSIDKKTLEKGYQYYSSNQVLEYDIASKTSTKIHIKSSVNGSGYEHYNQSIKLVKIDDILNITGGCSCPVGYNCKHIAAVCFEYIKDNSSNNFSSDIDVWLEKFIQENKKNIENKNSSNNEYFVLYRLFEDENKYHKDDIKFYKSKIIYKNKIGKGRLLSSDSFLYGLNYLDIIDSKDKDIIELCKGIMPKWESNSSSIQGELGYLILNKLCLTKRAFYKKENIPLEISNEIKDITFTWIDLDDKNSKLISNLTSDFKIIDTTPLLILDTKKHRFYNTNIEYSKNSLEALQKLPIVPNDKIDEVFEVISKISPNINLPTPQGFEYIKIDEKPIVNIKLFRVDNGRYKFHTINMSFKYGLYTIKYIPNIEDISFFENGSKIEIKRDLAFEIAAKKRLEDLGFSPKIKDDNLVFESLTKISMQDALQRWNDFLYIQIPILKDDGWDIVFDDSFTMKFENNSNIILKSENSDTNNWFDLSFDIEFNGIARPLLNLVSPILEQFEQFESLPEVFNLEVEENHFLKIDKNEIEPVLKTIFTLFNQKTKDDKFKLSPYDAHLIEDLNSCVVWKGSTELKNLSNKLKNYKGLENIEVSNCLNATLREYQQDGLNWFGFLYQFNFSGILADDMGLGKTIQTLAHLSRLKEDNILKKPSLIIMPTSLIANWKNEAKKFTPNLSVLSLQGINRKENYNKILNYDLILSTYPLITKDFEIYKNISFSYIVLDEAQKIKNPKTKMTIAIKSLKSDHRLALSGTPVENNLGELWSIFSFLMPGFLDTQSFFKNFYQIPIEKENNSSRRELLNKKIKPFMIRRTKEEVAKELPSKLIILKYTQFDTKQSKLYETIRVTMEKKVRETVKKKGIASSQITILDALLKLRQVCCDPSLLKLDEAKNVKNSAKLELLIDLLDELLEEKKKILIFSQFTSMLSIIEQRLISKKITYSKLTGSTTKREEVIDDFKSGKKDIFLISLKAGGVGLNLVEADTVIHYDPWWNPAVENQASDRVYRIGQTKAVFVYKLIIENSIEQKIIELQEKKQALQDGIFDSQVDDNDIIKGDELLELLK